MRSLARSLHLVALLSAAGSVALQGQIRLTEASLFAFGGGYSAAQHIFNLNTGTTDDFKTGFDLGGGVGVRLHRYAGVRLGVTGAQSQLRINDAETGVYLNRYYVGADVQGLYPLAGGLTPYGLAGGGVVMLHEKGTTGGNKSQGYGHLGLGVAYPVAGEFSLFVQGDAYFYSLSGLSGGALSAYSSAQRDIGWSVGASYKFKH